MSGEQQNNTVALENVDEILLPRLSTLTLTSLLCQSDEDESSQEYNLSNLNEQELSEESDLEDLVSEDTSINKLTPIEPDEDLYVSLPFDGVEPESETISIRNELLSSASPASTIATDQASPPACFGKMSAFFSMIDQLEQSERVVAQTKKDFVDCITVTPLNKNNPVDVANAERVNNESDAKRDELIEKVTRELEMIKSMRNKILSKDY